MNCNCCETNPNPQNYLTYATYEAGGVVKAELRGTTFDAANAIMRLCENADMKMVQLDGVSPDALMEYNYRGRAKVNKKDGDIFNEVIGQELARGKALHKYHKAYDKRICAFLADIRSLVATIEHYCAKKSIDISKVETVEELRMKRFGSCE